MENNVQTLSNDPFYRIAKLLGMDTSKYVITDEVDLETLKDRLGQDLYARVRQNSAEQNQSDLQTLSKSKNKNLVRKFERIIENIQKEKAPSLQSGLEKERLYQQAITLGISLPSYDSTSVSYSQYEDILRDIEKRIKDSGNEPVEHINTKEEQKAFSKAEARKNLLRSPFYRVAQQIGIDVSTYDPQNPADVSNDLAKITEQIREQLPEYLRNNDIKAFQKGLIDIFTQAEKDGWKPDDHSLKIISEFVDISTKIGIEKLDANTATGKDTEMSNEWMDKLIENPIYKAAVEAGLVTPGSITINSEEQLNNQLKSIDDLLKEKGIELNMEDKSSVTVEAQEGDIKVPENEATPAPESTEAPAVEASEPANDAEPAAESKEGDVSERKSLAVEAAPTDENLPLPVKTE